MGGAPVYCVIHDVKQRDKAFPATLADLAFPIRTTGRRCADRARPNLSNAVKSEKHGEVAPEDLSGNLIVQLGLATEKLNGAVVSKAPPKGGISCGVVQPPLDPFFCCRFRNRMPGPPPFSSMNSTPAASNAFRSERAVDMRAAMVPGLDSRRFIVGSDTDEALARSRCSHRSSARAARINSLLRTGAGFPISHSRFDTLGIDLAGPSSRGPSLWR
jgi:hypothetical protein